MRGRLRRLDESLTATRLAVLAGLLTLGVGIYLLTLPSALNGVLGWNEGYDEGVYVGAAVRFVNGVMPYRHFVLVQPPGIVLLFSPLALFGRAFGTLSSLELARLLTVLVLAANAVLAGLIMRPLGRFASAVAAFSLGTWMSLAWVGPHVELEPYLVFFDLVGIFLVFKGDEIASTRSVFFGGVAFGFATVVKVWGVLLAPLILLCLLRSRRKAGWLTAGVLVGGLVPTLPFFLAAPHAFFHDVITTQLGRNLFVGAAPTSFSYRLLFTTGMNAPFATGLITTTVAVAAITALFLALVLTGFAFARRRLLLVEWVALLASAAAFGGMFVSPFYAQHYAYFPAGFLCLLLASSLSRSREALLLLFRRFKRAGAPAPRRLGHLGFVCVAVATTSFLVVNQVRYGRLFYAEASNPTPALDALIPPGACVVSDYYVDLLAADRFTAASPSCPAPVDPLGMFLAEDNGNPQNATGPFPSQFVTQWVRYLSEAGYAELRTPYSDFIPWTRASIVWFEQRFRLVGGQRYAYPSPTIFDSYKAEYVYANISVP